MGAHLFPNFIGDCNAVSVQVHREGCDDVRFRAVSDCRRQWLACEHMGTVQLATDHTVEQHLPVRLCFQCHEQALVEEITVLVSDRERRHISQFDEAEGQFVLFQLEALRICNTRHGHRGG